MKRNRVFRLLASLTVVVLCMTAFSVTAFAGGGDGDYYTGEPAETTPEPTEEPATGGMEPEGPEKKPYSSEFHPSPRPFSAPLAAVKSPYPRGCSLRAADWKEHR